LPSGKKCKRTWKGVTTLKLADRIKQGKTLPHGGKGNAVVGLRCAEGMKPPDVASE